MPHSWFSEKEDYSLFEAGDREKEKRKRKQKHKKRHRGQKQTGVTDETADCEEIIKRTLSYWSILYEIPFRYLVPHENMLPNNSLRFFFLDSNWIRTMLDGALSVGRNSKSDLEHDKIFIDNIYNEATGTALTIREMLQRKRSDIDLTVESPQNNISSGFIMRSPLVLGWRGLDFVATDTKNEVLKALRIENLASDVLMGLYVGQIKQLIIHEPPEGLHFEVMAGSDGQYLRLRDKDTGEENKNEIPVKTKNYTDIPQKSSRVIDIRALAKDISLSATSADIALQLIKLPSYAKFFEK